MDYKTQIILVIIILILTLTIYHIRGRKIQNVIKGKNIINKNNDDDIYDSEMEEQEIKMPMRQPNIPYNVDLCNIDRYYENEMQRTNNKFPKMDYRKCVMPANF